MIVQQAWLLRDGATLFPSIHRSLLRKFFCIVPTKR